MKLKPFALKILKVLFFLCIIVSTSNNVFSIMSHFRNCYGLQIKASKKEMEKMLQEQR